MTEPARPVAAIVLPVMSNFHGAAVFQRMFVDVTFAGRSMIALVVGQALSPGSMSFHDPGL
jgi:hypothetical protein